MTKQLLARTLEDLYAQAIPQMDAEKPKKMFGEAERIYHFGFESFQTGFLYGMNAGIGTNEEKQIEEVK